MRASPSCPGGSTQASKALAAVGNIESNITRHFVPEIFWAHQQSTCRKSFVFFLLTSYREQVHDVPMPKPKKKGADDIHVSIRLDRPLKARLDVEADRQRRSLSSLLRILIEERFEQMFDPGTPIR